MDKALTESTTAIKEEISDLQQGNVDLNDTPARYLAFFGRLRPIVQPYTRMLAYTSEVGEAFRPSVHARYVTGAYAISWLYLIGDVGYEGYKANLIAKHTPDANVATVVGLTIAQRSVFQATASMLLPSLMVHSIVKYSAIAVKRSAITSVRLRAWLPTVLGLSVVPGLPYLFDEPVEHATEYAFKALERQFVKDPATLVALKSKIPEKEL